MSSRTPASSSSDRAGWRGRRVESEQRTAVQHGWQERGPDHPHERLRKRRVRTRRKVLLVLLGFGLLLASLLYGLLDKPQQTPVVYIAPTGYSWPLPPTAMAVEDKRALKDLDDRKEGARKGRNDTLEFTDISEAWESRDAGMAALRENLQRLSKTWNPRRPIVIYLCLHGVSDENGTPYLVTPDASPTNPETWLKFDRVLQLIGDVGQQYPSLQRRSKLLVLDCSRMPRNWSMGLLRNRFSEGAEQLIHRSQIPNLAVLNSTSPGQQAFVWREQQTSVFAHFLRAGVSGEAAKANSYVSVRELEEYLAKEVNKWARQYRNAAQTPVAWFTSNTKDFRIAHRIRGRLKAPTKRAGSSTVRNDLVRFWKAYDEMRNVRVEGDELPPLQTGLLAWHEFEHRLMWLQQLAGAGDGYKTRAGEVTQDLSNAVDAFEKQRDRQASAFTFWEGFDSYNDLLPTPATHSIPLSRYFGASRRQQGGLKAIRQSLTAATQQPTREGLNNVRRQMLIAAAEQDVPALIEGYLPDLLDRYWMPGLPERAGQIQRALELRDAIEQLAAPQDQRLIRWMRPILNRADDERRRAEDLLFAMDSNVDQRLRAAEEAVVDAKERQSLLAEAYRLRDRGWAELPYLAIWFTRPDPQVAGTGGLGGPGDKPTAGQPSDVVANSLVLAIGLTHALDVLLEGDAEDDRLVDQILPKTREVGEAHQALRNQLASDFQRLRSRESLSAGANRDILRLLSLPLLSSTQRAELEEQAMAFRPEEVADGEMPGAAVRWESRLDHPALLLVDPQFADGAASHGDAESSIPAGGRDDGDAGDGNAGEGDADEGDADEGDDASRIDSSLLASHERALRDHLRQLPTTLRKTAARRGSGSDQAGWRHAESLLRPCAALATINRGLRQANPLNKLRRFHLQQLLLWHGRRALTDLSPLGEELAGDYFEAARSISPLPNVVSDELSKLRRDISRFGRDGLRVDTEQLLLPISNANLRANVRQLHPAMVAPSGDETSIGHATLFVRDSRGNVVNPRPREIAVPIDSQSGVFELELDIDSKRNPTLYTVLMFRGREFTEDFLPETIGGFRVDFAPQVYDRSQVTLHGYRSRRASIIFVLDCSFSMRQTIPGEQQDDPRSRMEIAKSKLQEMLQQLSREDDVRVGVYFFGHRRGWSRENANQAITQDVYAGADAEQLDSLQPGEDVEEVLALGRFGPLIAEGVIDKLENVVGWGQTPLYLALVEAQRAFAADDPDTDKSIVVITDGRNFQFAPPNNPLGPLNSTGVEDVVEAYRQHQGKVHIVSLALQADDVADAEKEFEDLARETGGKYVAARNASTLVSQLRDLLGPARYGLEDLDGREVGVRADGSVGPTLLEDPLAIQPVPDGPTLFKLQHDQLTKRIEVSPGDALALRVSDSGRFIEAIPFDDNGLASQADLVVGRTGRATPLVARAHPPIANIKQGKVRFQVSVQRKDLEVTSRPAESWVEITPLAKDGVTELEPTYFFYDRDFQANQPVPVVAWDALDWPFGEAPYARIRFWCKPTRTLVPDEGRIAIRDILADPDAYATPRDVGQLAPGVRIRIEGRKTPDAFRIDVVEVHRDPNPDMGALRIEVAGDPNAPLQRVSRQFDREHGIAIHSFIFPATADGVFRRSGDAQLLLIPGNLIKNDAWQLPSGEALEVEVSSGGSTLTPGPVLSLPRN